VASCGYGPAAVDHYGHPGGRPRTVASEVRFGRACGTPAMIKSWVWLKRRRRAHASHIAGEIEEVRLA
jgi:hypothetical protein